MKSEPWLLVSVKEISVHLFLPDYREQLNIERRWFDKIPREVEDAYAFYSSKMKRRM